MAYACDENRDGDAGGLCGGRNLGGPRARRADAPGPPQHQHAATEKAKAASDMAVRCQAMMAEREQMMSEMKAADQRLDDLVARMNTASDTEKVAATVAVVNELVAQRRTMRDGMMKMQHGMMGHMMGHMQAGKDAMAMCPMMKPMGGMKH